MQSTQEQRELIAYKIYKAIDHNYFQEIISKTPRNNEKYPDTRCDYTQMILADNLSPLNSGQADYIIKAYNGKYGYHLPKARSILETLKLTI